MCVRKARGSAADWRHRERRGVRWTPDSDNRGPRPGVRCQVDRGRMAEVRPANQRPGSGAISQSEDSVAQLNNYHITQGIL